MKIAIIGATGFIGSVILQEALQRGHQVTGIVRHPEKLPAHPALAAQKGDITNETEVAAPATPTIWYGNTYTYGEGS